MGVQLAHLLLSNRAKLEDVGLEAGAESAHTIVGFLLGSSDILHSSGKALILQYFCCCECSIHARGGVCDGSIGICTVLGHAGADLVELGCSLGSDLLDLVVGILTELLIHGFSLGSKLRATLASLFLHISHLLVEGVHCIVEIVTSLICILLDLCSISSDVLVSLLDPGVGGRVESGKCTLLGKHSEGKLLCTFLLVLAHNLAGLLGASNGLLVAPALQGSNTSKLALGAAHSCLKIILGNLGVNSHLCQKHGLHLLTSSSIQLHVLGHLLSDCRDVRLAGHDLLGDVGLHLVKEGEKSLATLLALLQSVWSLGVQETSLHHIRGVDRPRMIHILTGANLMLGSKHDLFGGVRSDVHDAAAHGQAAEQTKGNARAGCFGFFHCYTIPPRDDNADTPH